MPSVRIDSATLHYEVDGDGPAVVFVHGGEGTHLHWWQQVTAFRHTHTCITYDQRGFGLSGGAFATDPATHHTDLLALLDALAVDRAVVVGQSHGGQAASGLALNHPERVAALVMADTPFNIATEALSTWAAAMIEKLQNGFDVVAACLSPSFSERCPDLHFLYHALSRLNPPRTGPRGLDAYVRFRDQPPGDFRNFTVPTLCIVGEEDALTFPWLMEATADALGARLERVPDAGHAVYYEQAGVFNAVVLDWLRSLR